MTCEFQIARRVEVSDTDRVGRMHFSNFFRFMETTEHALAVPLNPANHRRFPT